MTRIRKNIRLATYALTFLLMPVLTFAAERTVHYFGIAQSHITTDSQGDGLMILTCNVFLRNVSTISQRVTAFKMNGFMAVPSGANFQNQTGPSQVVNTYFAINGSGGGSATTASLPVVLDPINGGQDSLHLRGVKKFQYRGNYDNGSGVPAEQNVNFHCHGSITVVDVGDRPGSVIASGAMETVAGSEMNPKIQYGAAITANQDSVAAVTGVDSHWKNPEIAHQQNFGQFKGNILVTIPPVKREWATSAMWDFGVPGATCVASWNDAVLGPRTATLCGCAGNPDHHFLCATCSQRDAFGTTFNDCYGESSAFSNPNGTPAVIFGAGIGLNTGMTLDTVGGSTPPQTNFPQQIHSSPITINSGKPF